MRINKICRLLPFAFSSMRDPYSTLQDNDRNLRNILKCNKRGDKNRILQKSKIASP